MRYLTLSWDDGFRESTLRTAELFEKHGLRAEFNVLAAPSSWDEEGDRGDFAVWNELQARAHVIQPHGYNHTNKAEVPFAEAQGLILRCLDAFSELLAGFDARHAIFNFPYNSSTPELEAWLPSVVRAFRTRGGALNPLPTASTVKLTTGGWEDAEPWLGKCVDQLLSVEDGWIIYNGHGLDGEGWGPIRSDYLDRMLGKLVEGGEVMVVPASDVLDRVNV